MKKLYTTLEMKASDEDRTVEFVASKEVTDRDGEILKIEGINLKNYKKNPVVLWAHDRSGLPIGKTVKFTKVGKGLNLKVKFAEPEVYGFADTVFKLVKGGYINAVSIGFMPDYDKVEYPKNRKGVHRIFHASELLELSIVPVPANQDALRTSKALEDGVIDEVELKEWQMFCKEAIDNEEIIEEDKVDMAELENLAELRLELEEVKAEFGYLKDLFSELEKDASAANAANEARTDELTEEDMIEIMDTLGIKPEDIEEGE